MARTKMSEEERRQRGREATRRYRARNLEAIRKRDREKCRTAEYRARRRLYETTGKEGERRRLLGRSLERRAVIEARVRLRRDLMQRWKLAAGCIDCGYADDPKRLHFDHVMFPKLFNPADGVGRSHKNLADELWKCVVRCIECHAKKTARDQRLKITAMHPNAEVL